MCLDIGHDFYCAYQDAWVARSEFNSDKSFTHYPKDGPAYVAVGWGECKCITCDATDKTKCKTCDNKARYESKSSAYSRCKLCKAQYKMHGKLMDNDFSYIKVDSIMEKSGVYNPMCGLHGANVAVSEHNNNGECPCLKCSPCTMRCQTCEQYKKLLNEASEKCQMYLERCRACLGITK